MKRAFVPVLMLLLATAACTSNKNVASPAPSEAPTSTPSSQSIADFQLVGRAQHAFVGIGPGFDTTATVESATPSPVPTGSFGAAFQPGVMRILLDDASDALKTNCGAARDETINVFWTTGTQFDNSLLGADLESSLEGRTLGVVGRLFMAQTGSTLAGEETPGPSASPGATANPECVLVADQIATSTGTIPTAAPRLRTHRTATPTVRVTPTPAATHTATPTIAPSPSVVPSPLPT